jgi:hypothetical protein
MNLWGFLNKSFFTRWGRYPHAQSPNWRTSVSLFVWVITFDLSGMGVPASRCATAGLALRIIWPHKPTSTLNYGHLRGNPTFMRFISVPISTLQFQVYLLVSYMWVCPTNQFLHW